MLVGVLLCMFHSLFISFLMSFFIIQTLTVYESSLCRLSSLAALILCPYIYVICEI